jgi:hypothetical protein
MAKSKYVRGIDVDKETKHQETACELCTLANMKRGTHKKKHFVRLKNKNGRSHLDLIGPVLPLGRSNKSNKAEFRYMAVFTDDATGIMTTYAMIKKTDVVGIIKHHTLKAERQSGKPLQTLHGDNELDQKAITDWAATKGINVTFSPPYTPERNSIAESSNRILLTVMRAIFAKAPNIPYSFWPQVMSAAVNIINRVLRRGQKKTPYEQWHGERPYIAGLRTLGCRAYAYSPKEVRKQSDKKQIPSRGITNKFKYRADPCILIGYADRFTNYLLWDVAGQRIFTSCHVAFDESKFPSFKPNNQPHRPTPTFEQHQFVSLAPQDADSTDPTLQRESEGHQNTIDSKTLEAVPKNDTKAQQPHSCDDGQVNELKLLCEIKQKQSSLDEVAPRTVLGPRRQKSSQNDLLNADTIDAGVEDKAHDVSDLESRRRSKRTNRNKPAKRYIQEIDVLCYRKCRW